MVISGLTNPTVVRFASDGRVFVAEKSGLIKVFDSLADPTPTVFADLRTNVHNFWDRGLLGLALAPELPDAIRPSTSSTRYDAAIGGVAPRWGTAGATSDPCPTPPGATGDGCVVSGRLSRLQAAGNVMTGPEQVLVEDWCQQYPSHSVGILAFGADGALYVSGGDGASFNFADWGQDGNPLNPCGDPPGGVGALTPPTAEGGALRSQDLRTSRRPGGPQRRGAAHRPGDRRRHCRTTRCVGDPIPTPGGSSRYGLAQPVPLTVRPGTTRCGSATSAGTAGRRSTASDDPTAPRSNFGWPCYEGNGRQSGYDGANLEICENLYAQAGAVADSRTSRTTTAAQVVAGDETARPAARRWRESRSRPGASYPALYDGALFFADYSRDCIWVMRAGANGRPDPSTRAGLRHGCDQPRRLQFGPGGALYYADFDGGTIRRVAATGSDSTPPTVSITAPAGGAILTGTTTVTASATDNSGTVAGVQFRLDGTDLGAEDTSAPYSLPWDTTDGIERLAHPHGRGSGPGRETRRPRRRSRSRSAIQARRRLRGSSPPTASTRGRARPQPTRRATGTPARSRARRGRRAAATAAPCRSTAQTTG